MRIVACLPVKVSDFVSDAVVITELPVFEFVSCSEVGDSDCISESNCAGLSAINSTQMTPMMKAAESSAKGRMNDMRFDFGPNSKFSAGIDLGCDACLLGFDGALPSQHAGNVVAKRLKKISFFSLVLHYSVFSRVKSLITCLIFAFVSCSLAPVTRLLT